MTEEATFVQDRRSEPTRRPTTALRRVARQTGLFGRFGPIEVFVFTQILCQVLLLVPAIGPFRILVRSAALGLSLALLAMRKKPCSAHPATAGARAVMIILTLSLLNPGMNSFGSAFAQWAMYLAVIAPIWWVARVPVDRTVVNRVFLTLWGFHAVSAITGVLQVYFPGRFQPSISSVIAADPDYLNSLTITLSDGREVLRPMGLTDVPGGAAMSGFYAALLGLMFLATVSGRNTTMRVGALGSIWVGLFCLYVSQVRAVLVTATICSLCFMALLAWRRRVTRVSVVAGVLVSTVMGAFFWAAAVGGESVTGRIGTLLSDDPGALYYRNRGRFLDHTVNVLLPEYPLGAGMGRWGMMNAYFGDPTSRENQPLWTEIQWTGWLLDGGVPLIVAFVITIGLTVLTVWRLTARLNPDHWLWAFVAFLVAYDLGAIALTFSYPVFHSQTGLEFWLLNTLVYVAYVGRGPRGRGAHK